MAKDFKVGIEIGADANKAISGMSKLEKQLGMTRGQMIAVGAAAVAAATAVVAFGMKAVKAASFQEAQQNALAAAMKNAGTYTEQAYQHNLAYASSLQKITTFGDEAILGVQKMLTNFGIQGKMLDKITKSTLDLAVAGKMDLKSAADLVAKSVGSSTNALSRYGIVVEGAVGSTDRMQMAVDNIAKLFGGSAEAELQTYSGRMAELKNAVGDVWEEIGFLLLPTLTDLLKQLTPIIVNIGTWIKETDSLKNGVNSIVTTLSSMVSIIQTLSKVSDNFVVKGLKNGMIAAFNAMITPISVIKKAFEELSGKTEEASDKIQKHSNIVKDAYTSNVSAAKSAQAEEFALMDSKFNYIQEKLIEEQGLKDEFAMQEQMNDLFLIDYKKGVMQSYYDWNAEKLAEQAARQQLFTEQVKLLHANMNSALTTGFATSMKNMLDNGANFANVMTTISNAIRDVFINMIAEVLAKWVLSHGLMTAATLTWKGITMAANASVAAASAAVSAFKAIPFPFNIAAAAAAAYGAYSLVSSFFATGVRGFGGGMAMVGERGPELVNLPGGSNVYNTSETGNMLGRAGNAMSKVINLNVSFSGNSFLGGLEETANIITDTVMQNIRLQANV